MAKRLTSKQNKFIEGIVQGKSGTQSAVEAYNVKNRNVANAIAAENLAKPSIKQALAPLLDKHNVTLDQYVQNIGESMQAYKMNQLTGEVTPDYTTRLSANKQAEKLLGINQLDIKPLDNEPELDKTHLLEAINDKDEVAITHAVFSKAPEPIVDKK